MSLDQELVTVLRDAIQSEIASYELYTKAVDLVEAQNVKGMLRELAAEEQGHRAALEKMLTSPGTLRANVRQLKWEPVQDYKIGDHLVVKPLGPDSTFADVCIFSSRKEQESYQLYSGLAEQNEGEIAALFQAMAKDELKHKNLVEGWYDEVVYKEN